MGGIFSYDNPIMSAISKIANCILLNMLFLICCIPIVTAGASFTAMYYTVEKNIKNNRGYVCSSFFTSFKENLKKATPVWILLFAIELIFLSDYFVVNHVRQAGNMLGNIYPLFFVMMILVALYAVWFFANLARFDNSVKNLMKNSLILMIRFPGTTFLILCALIFACVITYLIPIAGILMPVIATWLFSAPIEHVFTKCMK